MNDGVGGERLRFAADEVEREHKENCKAKFSHCTTTVPCGVITPAMLITPSAGAPVPSPVSAIGLGLVEVLSVVEADCE